MLSKWPRLFGKTLEKKLMSEALNYLLAVRKETVSPYFEFLKKSGEHLDDKTRFLFSVVSKVHAQTEKGFKQYLIRAMQAGNSADEILDALLASMPMLGFSKIVWAIDIILEMGIPEFSPEILGKVPSWNDVCDVKSLSEGISRLECAGRDLFVYKRKQEIKVYDTRCPHQATNIPLDVKDSCQLICPKHQWKFDLQSGDCVEKGSRPLTEFESKVEAGKLKVYF